jgi:RNA polymerase sigma-70 factor (ECF subfamily)
MTYSDCLLEEARRGDRSAFWQLAERYRPYLKTVARNVLGAVLPSDGSDVVADGLCLAFERFAQFKDSHACTFLAWLARIVRNSALKSLQRAGHLRPLQIDPNNELQLPTGSPTPSDRAARREQSAILLEAIYRLPEPRRTVILLRTFDDLAFQEIAQRMDRTCDAVRQLWVQAVKQLGKILGKRS